ncbi:SusC/RagA family TonB-linked outer membrane protein [Chondrinema litorale]|uniref:SusC/RagA family TonB-linked outer membrane protein n=1 Tax=Chondrinema litorale TaxID=2994555 RepID=UPI002543EFEC|nr:SusC/RagA family TonB-linked outer membrane protein [Chondrinema litorale]UZR97357.1 SusC/RagA family TonB-linked outer membrane protein [Chondrinema litorale]
MKKGLIISLIFLVACSQILLAQDLVKGRVTSSEDNEPLPGVSIVVQGTNKGTTTDLDGNFSVQATSEDVLLFSYIGYLKQSITVGTQTTIDVSLVPDAQQLDEVVVTALGIERDEKALSYAQQTISADDIRTARDVNFVNSLAGKAAGVSIQKSSSGTGGSTKIVLRGNKSLSGDSQPLFVIDGIPMANNKGGQPGMWGGNDEGDGLSQINPDDIESVSILRGANAAALYGSQGANGVVLITTKKGKEGKAVVTFNTGVTFENVMAKPQLQFDYGSVGGAKESWSYEKGDYADNYVDDFFQTGVNAINTITISGGNDKTTAYFSYGNTSSKGIIPKNTYQKNNFTLKQSTKMANNKLTISSSIMLMQEEVKNRPPAGYYLNPLTGLYFFPRDRDFESFKNNYEVFDETRNMNLQNWFVSDHHQSNPYWLINKQPRTDATKRVIASIPIKYEFNDKLSVQVRGNYDYAEKLNEQKFYAGGNATNIGANGRWSYQKYNDELVYGDAIITYNNTFGDFSLNGVAGTSYQQSTYGDGVSVDTETNSLLYPNEFFFQNLPTNVQVQSVYTSKLIKEAVFLNATLGFKEVVYLDFSGRNDWASTLAGTGNDSYFYPAVGLTGIISDMVVLPDFISFAKVRVSYSEVGNEVPFNRINPQHTINSGGGVDRNTERPFTNLKPEMIRSVELGTNWRFLNGRVGFDFTYYNLNSQDQFIRLPAPSGSGYSYYYVNAGEVVNKGVEITLETTPLTSQDAEWTSTFNFSRNVNEIVELHPDLSDKIYLSDSEGFQSVIEAGGSFNDIYVYKFQRDDQGRIILDSSTGTPLKTAEPEYIGNLNPKFSLGWTNGVSYKNFALNFLIYANIGGKVVSQTEAMLDGYGVSKRSGDARDAGGVTIDAVQDDVPVTTIDPRSYYTTIGDRNGIKEPYVYDRTNIRLTQFSLSYNINTTSLNIPVKAASISFVGQNLFFFYKKAPFDPELAMSTSTDFQSLDNFNLPSTRTFGFNLKLTL